MRVFYIGAPGPCGGANSEMAHTLPVWRRAGIEVGVIPTWGIGDDTRASLEAIGCEVHDIKSAEKIADVPGLAGGIVHSMCNSHFLTIFPKLKELGCKTVWSNAMTFMFDNERGAFQHYGPPDAMHFQSEFQQIELTRDLRKLGMEPNGVLIRGAFDFDAIPFNPRPHGKNGEFWIGRLSRPDDDKWSSNLFNILGAVPYDQRRALCMGWSIGISRKCGQPPQWAECLNPQQIPVKDFIGRCHAMIGLNGGARENAPRVGLEAMAAGVPVVAQNLWGWPETLGNGEGGILTNSDKEMEFYLAKLAYEEDFRQDVIRRARAHVEKLADPVVIGQQWKDLFTSLEEQKEAAA